MTVRIDVTAATGIDQTHEPPRNEDEDKEQGEYKSSN
jgi:hypothetical protein